MQPPFKPKEKPPEDLAEVERALSVLQGRHPEHERARREDQETLARRRAARDAAANADGKRAAGKRLVIVGAAFAALAGVAGIGLLWRSESVKRTRVAKLVEPYTALGYTVVDTSSQSNPAKLEAQAPQGCLLAVSNGPGPIRVERASGSFEGKAPALFCLCEAERVTLSAKGEGDGLALLSIDAATIGGSRAFAFAPGKTGTTSRTDDACAEASFDAWIDAKKWPKFAPNPKSLAVLSAGSPRAPLSAAGFQIVASASAEAPFAVVEMPKESCILAVVDGSNGPSAAPPPKLTLRHKGNASPFSSTSGALGYCAQAEDTLVVEREGAGAITALAVPATRVGGTAGLTDLAHEAGFRATTDVPEADASWDAKALLLASAIPDALVTAAATPDIPNDADARVVALSFGTAGALAPETESEVYSYCEPTLGPSVLASLCVFSGPQKWRLQGADATGGIARSKFPFWLFAIQGVNDPVALQAATRLLALARHLRREGFEPTTLEALTELPNGVEVRGRAGDDAVVALGVAPEAPYVFPFSDGAPWSLDQAPRIVPLAPQAKATLTSPMKKLPSKATRRTVVFRRQKH